MSETAPETPLSWPSSESIRKAISIYLESAYAGTAIPESVHARMPHEDGSSHKYLMGSGIERTPPSAVEADVHSFAIRLGNKVYPHMKLRISRPEAGVWIFTVDAHDVFLNVPKSSPDYEALEALKKENARLVSEIDTAWAQAGLPTEKSYLRKKIEQARARKLCEPE
jgi:hypothetical protein